MAVNNVQQLCAKRRHLRIAGPVLANLSQFGLRSSVIHPCERIWIEKLLVCLSAGGHSVGLAFPFSLGGGVGGKGKQSLMIMNSTTRNKEKESLIMSWLFLLLFSLFAQTQQACNKQQS